MINEENLKRFNKEADDIDSLIGSYDSFYPSISSLYRYKNIGDHDKKLNLTFCFCILSPFIFFLIYDFNVALLYSIFIYALFKSFLISFFGFDQIRNIELKIIKFNEIKKRILFIKNEFQNFESEINKAIVLNKLEELDRKIENRNLEYIKMRNWIKKENEYQPYLNNK